MKKLLQPLRWALPALLLTSLGAGAQTLNYPVSGIANVAGTYTDLAATGTAIATPNTDDANSAAQNIGFTFSYNGATFTQFVLNTNGFIKLGAVAPPANTFYAEDSTSTATDPLVSTEANLLLAFNADLTGGTGAQYRLATTGTAPNRVTTVQWKNVTDKQVYETPQYVNFSFQIKLYETTNVIEMVYAVPTAGSGTAAFRSSAVGLKGAGAGAQGPANNTYLFASKSSNTPWSGAAFTATATTYPTLNFRQNVLPDAGRTFRFTPAGGGGGGTTAPANDNCSGAIALTVGATCVPVTGDNTNGTASPAGVPAPTCGGAATNATNDIWYRVVVPTNGAVTVTTSAVTGSPFNDTVLQLFSGTCTALVQIGCNDDISATNGFSSVTVSGQTPGATLYARITAYFAAATTPNGPVGICAQSVTLNNNDASVDAIYTLGTISSAQSSPHAVQAVVTNRGANALVNRVVTLTVAGATVFTNAQTIASLASGASTVVTFAGYPVVGTTGTNTLTVSVPTDDVLTNNSQTATQLVTRNDVSYVQGTTFTGGAGLRTANAVLVARHTANSATNLSSVTIRFNGTAATPYNYQVVIYDATGANGVPGTVLYTSPARPRPAAGGDDVVPTPGTALAAGNFFVGVKTLTAVNPGIAYQTEAPLRGGVFFFSADGITWTDVNTSTLNSRLAIGATFAAPLTCDAVTNLAAASANNGTRANVTFTPSASAVSYTVTYQSGGNPAVTVTPNPTASPVVINGLTANTTYIITVTSNCAGGQTSAPAPTTVRTVLAAREALGNGSLSVFPNPAQGAFTLALPALAGERTAGVTLLNALGQTVYSRTLELNAAGTQARVEVSGLAKGIYTLRVKTSQQTATTSVVVE